MSTCLHEDTPGSLPHTLFRVFKHDRPAQLHPIRCSLAHMVMLRDLELEGMPIAIDEYLPVGVLPVVLIHTVALRLLAPLMVRLDRDDACNSAYQHGPTSCIYEKMDDGSIMHPLK